MILIGTDQGIYRWSEGSGWAVFHSLQARKIVGLSSPGAGALVAIDGDGQVLESTDNGQNWRVLPLPQGTNRPTAASASGSPAEILLTTEPIGVYKRRVGAPIPGTASDSSRSPGFMTFARSWADQATALLVPRKAGSGSGDSQTIKMAGWTKLSVPKPWLSGAKSRGLVTGSGPETSWYATVKGKGLWRSSDQGESWTQCAGLPSEVLAVRLAPDRPQRVAAATSSGCWISEDGGQSWEERSAGLENTRYVSAIAIKPGQPDSLLAGAGPVAPESASKDQVRFSLYESSNAGKSWSPVVRGNPDVFEGDVVADICFDPAEPSFILAALTSGELWTTINGGFYWVPLARQIQNARVLCPVV